MATLRLVFNFQQKNNHKKQPEMKWFRIRVRMAQSKPRQKSKKLLYDALRSVRLIELESF